MGLLDDAANQVSKGRDFINKQSGQGKQQGSVIPRPDFQSGFIIEELVNGIIQPKETIQLVGSMMPHQPFTFGGEQRVAKHYYPGNPEPSVHVLGPQETDITIKGRLYVKKYSNFDGGEIATADLRTIPEAIQRQLDAIRIRGNMVRIKMGEWYRYGFIQMCEFNMKTRADIEYSVTFSIIGFNAPKKCITVDRSKDVPIDINKELISAYAIFRTEIGQLPDGFNQDLASQIEGFANDLGAAVSTVTDFIDGAFQAASDLNNAINRVLGVIKNAQQAVFRYQNQLGRFGFNSPLINYGGTAQASNNRSYMTNAMDGGFSLMSFLAALLSQFESLQASSPLARVRVKAGDTLQDYAVKYYGAAENWELIYDHNGLISTDLTVGDVLEIPRA